MLTLHDIDRFHNWLPRFETWHGGYRIGLIEQVEPRLGFGDQTPCWSWRLSVFSAPMSEPTEIACHGFTKSESETLTAITASWQSFIDLTEMPTGVLRLKRTADHVDGYANFDVMAGRFYLGRIYRATPSTGITKHERATRWQWLLSSILPQAYGETDECEQAMAEIKAAWRARYALTQQHASTGP